MLCLYLLGQHCLHLTFYAYLSSKTYSRKYEKLPNIIIHACKILQKKRIRLKYVAHKFGLCLFTFRPIASKQLNSLTTIDTLSWLGGAVVTYPLWVHEVPGSIPGSAKGFMFVFCLFCCLCVFTFCPETHYLSHNLQFFLQ